VSDRASDAATELMKQITPAKIEDWTRTAPMDWAKETRQGASCDQPSGKVRFDAADIAANAPILREQLQKADVRLAHMLDAALSK
jgi:S1/P1 Nuclease